MNTPVILKYKLQMPALRPNLVKRAALHEPVRGLSSPKLILIVAPAGSGKTTAMAQYMQMSSARTTWYSLGEHDNDLRRFWRYVVHALAPHLATGATERLLPLLAEHQEHALHQFLDQCLNELYDAPEPIMLALDDYHLITRPEIHGCLHYWLEHLPSSIQVVLASRFEPPFEGLHKWIVRGEVKRINAKELAFTTQDAEQLCQSVLEVALPSQWIEALVARTEGWAAGLQLALMSLQQRSSDQWSAWIHTGHVGQQLEEYLFQELWKGLDEQMGTFLLETSILRKFNAALCADITGQGSCNSKLAFLERNGLFLVHIQQDEYRYHHLVREFYARMLKQQAPARWSELHRQASLVHAQMGLSEEAIDHAFMAEDYELAASLLNRHLHELVTRGEFTLLQNDFARFPASFAMPPRLQLVNAFVHLFMGQRQVTQSLIEQLEQELLGRSQQVESEWLSGLFFVKANDAFYSGQFEEWFQFADSIPYRLPKDPVFYDFNYNFNQPLVRNTTFGLKGVITPTTAEVGERICSILSRNGWSESLMCQYVIQSLAEGYYEWNELDRCDEFLSRLIADGRYLEVPGLYVPVRIMMAKRRLAAGEPAAARIMIQESMQRLAPATDGHWYRALRAYLVELNLGEGENLAASREQLQGQEDAASHRVHLGNVQETVTLARLHMANGRGEDALALLTTLRLQAEEVRMVNILALTMVLQAKAEYIRGRKKEAVERLNEALLLVLPFRYIRTFIDEGKWMRELLQEIATAVSPDQQSALKEYINVLLVAMQPQAEREISIPNSYAGMDSLSAQELEVVRLLHSGCTNQEIAHQMGLTLGTIKVYLNRIYSKLGVRSRTQAVLATSNSIQASRTRLEEAED